MSDIILCKRMQRCQIHPLLWHDFRTPAAKPNYSVISYVGTEWGPHRFIPSGEGASPSPFGPLNVRGWVCEPPCGGPPWPPLLPGPRKQKIRGVVGVVGPDFCRVRIIIGKTFRPYAPYIQACHRLWVNFVDGSHLFSRKLRRKGLMSHFFLGNF